MAIKVTIEPNDDPAMESCFHCYQKTKYWYLEKDVACCPTCASFIQAADVPSKKQWYAAVMKALKIGYK